MESSLRKTNTDREPWPVRALHSRWYRIAVLNSHSSPAHRANGFPPRCRQGSKDCGCHGYRHSLLKAQDGRYGDWWPSWRPSTINCVLASATEVLIRFAAWAPSGAFICLLIYGAGNSGIVLSGSEYGLMERIGTVLKLPGVLFHPLPNRLAWLSFEIAAWSVLRIGHYAKAHSGIALDLPDLGRIAVKRAEIKAHGALASACRSMCPKLLEQVFPGYVGCPV